MPGQQDEEDEKWVQGLNPGTLRRNSWIVIPPKTWQVCIGFDAGIGGNITRWPQGVSATLKGDLLSAYMGVS